MSCQTNQKVAFNLKVEIYCSILNMFPFKYKEARRRVLIDRLLRRAFKCILHSFI